MTDTLFNTDTPTSGSNKYDTWDAEQLKRKAEAADNHIRTLEAENANLRETTKQNATIEEILDRLDNKPVTPPNFSPNPVVTNPPDKPSSSAITKDDVMSLIEQQRKNDQAKANVDLISKELQKVWGEDFPSKVTQKAKNLGVNKDFLASMAENYPQAFLKLVLEDVQKPTNPNSHVPPTSTTFQPKTPEGFVGETWKDFSKAMKQNPSLRTDPTFSRRMHDQAAKLGDSFYN